MSWIDHHRISESHASKAEVLLHRGDQCRAIQHYAKAAEAEVQALEVVGHDKPRTYGITAVSAVALHLKAAMLHPGKILAYRCLGTDRLPAFARVQMEELLDAIKMHEVGFASNARLLVAARGGTVLTGGAPWDVVVPQMQRVVSMFQRTTEYIKNVPHRKRGSPSKELQESFLPWIFQTVPSSYQFAITLQEQRQVNMFENDVTTKQIVDRVMGILDVCATSPMDRISDVVPDDEYAITFLKLARDMAPTGKAKFSQLNFRTGLTATPVVLDTSARQNIRDALNNKRPPSPDAVRDEVHGILRAVHLNDDWIGIASNYDGKMQRIEGAGEEVDDRIGPMVNQAVLVQVERLGPKVKFVDIEIDE